MVVSVCEARENPYYLLYEENDEGVMVFAGPFPNNDIDLKLDFLIKNGYINAKKTR